MATLSSTVSNGSPGVSRTPSIVRAFSHIRIFEPSQPHSEFSSVPIPDRWVQ
jgi:hypothetical protein